MDRFWAAAVKRQPALFDGPAVACLSVDAGPDGHLDLAWARISYRYRALRQVSGASWRPASLFVTVLQPVSGGGLIVGRGSATTAHPGRWALPGGSVEPPGTGGLLDAGALRFHAVRELAEEVGVAVRPDAVAGWGVTRGEHGNIGIHFIAPPLASEAVFTHHRGLVEAERGRGAAPELDRLAVVRCERDVAALGDTADFLAPAVARYAHGERGCF